jgi:superfamily II DNA/RNA helicase
MWPCVASSKSFVAIARRGGGKTMGYLIPLISRLLNVEREDPAYPERNEGPLAVIVCPTWKMAIDTYAMVNNVIRGRK